MIIETAIVACMGCEKNFSSVLVLTVMSLLLIIYKLPCFFTYHVSGKLRLIIMRDLVHVS